MYVIIISLIVGFGIYEVGALFHNLSVMNKTMSTAANYASRGAPVEEIRERVVTESGNLIGGAFLEQSISEDPALIIEVWNPETDSKLGTSTKGNHTFRPQCSKSFPPREKYVTPYMFWASEYEIRVGVLYEIGIYVPFLDTITVDMTVSDAKRIVDQNDLDRDGMNDAREANYVEWAMDNKATGLGLTSDTDWINPVHRDEVGVVDTAGPDHDIDGDGITSDNDTMPFDLNNNEVEDKYDKAERNDIRNLLTMNPLIGPGVRPAANSDKWWGGSCP